MTRPIRLLLLVVAGVTFPTRGAHAQGADSTPPARAVLDGVYTVAQADTGAMLYAESCANCHAKAQFSDAAFRRAWQGRAAYDLFELLRTTMPYDAPGGFSPPEYAAIVAYIFRLNGYPAGERALPSDAEGLKRVPIPSRSDSEP